MVEINESKDLSGLLLGSSTYRVLNFLTLHPDESFYDKEISEHTGVSRGSTNQTLRGLLENNLVYRVQRGKMWFYYLKDQPLIKYFRIYENLVELQLLVESLSDTAQRIILFGSAAEGTDTAASDIDLFVITNQPDQIMAKIQNFPAKRRISPIIQTPSEYAVSRTKDKAFYDRVEKGIKLLERAVDE
ncbi:MAG: nucleotidyltransferase domain-containing protein [bacterium]|nr:nucleotidyltransferase domain-containing protein [bacterium]